MSEIQGLARQKIHPGKLEEFKRLVAKCMESVRTRHPRMLPYDLYFNSDYTECVTFERYRDFEALLEHIANLDETMDAILKTGSISGEICGTPSPELRKALKGSGVRIYLLYQSI